jgi:hypothetical protein
MPQRTRPSREQLEVWAQQNRTFNDIASERGVTGERVRQWFVAEGVEKPNHRSPMPSREQLIENIEHGLSDADIAAKWSVSEKYMYSHRLSLGVERPRKVTTRTVHREPVFADDCILVPLTKGRVTVLDLEDADLAEHNWCLRGVYASRTEGTQGNRTIVTLHIVIMERILGRPLADGEEPDHKDLDYLNNRRSNLRLATRSLNMANKGLIRSNTSGFKWVHWRKRERKWAASVTKGGKAHFVGFFDIPQQAADAADKKARELYGEFALTNADIQARQAEMDMAA